MGLYLLSATPHAPNCSTPRVSVDELFPWYVRTIVWCFMEASGVNASPLGLGPSIRVLQAVGVCLVSEHLVV